MEAAGLSEAAMAAFKKNYDQLVAGATGMVGPTASTRSALDACSRLRIPVELVEGLRVLSVSHLGVQS
jgi:hypothetical protein